MGLILASASPRRTEILAGLGLHFEAVPSGFDEGALRGLGPRAHALAAAAGKAEAVARDRPGDSVIGIDTVVAVDGTTLGKPADGADARRMLAVLSGRDHAVISAVHVVRGASSSAGHAISQVRFRRLSRAEIDAYVATGEPADKAGAYAIQGGARAFASVTRGRLDTVVGLPTHLLRRLLRRVGDRDFANLGPLR
jgi:septum formation protein